jgi:NitT/TauT family transport system substrate-binding protein
MHYTVISPEAPTQAIGYTDMTKAASMVDMVMEFGAPKDAKKPETADLFTNDLVPSIELSDAEWAQVKTNVAEYATILG